MGRALAAKQRNGSGYNTWSPLPWPQGSASLNRRRSTIIYHGLMHFIGLQVTCVQGVLCPSSSMSDLPGLPQGRRPEPTWCHAPPASVHLSRREQPGDQCADSFQSWSGLSAHSASNTTPRNDEDGWHRCASVPAVSISKNPGLLHV